MSGSLPIFLVESEYFEMLESLLATGRAVQRKEARAPLSSVSHSSPLTHICFPPVSANRLKLTLSSHQMTQSFSFSFFFFWGGGFTNLNSSCLLCLNDKILKKTYSNKNLVGKKHKRNSLLEFSQLPEAFTS